jgi:hypothetical protein
MNSTVYSVDPSNSASLVFAYANFVNLYKGQTSIIRFNLTMLDKQFYDIGISVSSNLAADTFQLHRFFISNVGDNFPCTPNSVPVTLTNG